MAYFPGVSNPVGDVFNAPVISPPQSSGFLTGSLSSQCASTRYPSRASLGGTSGSYVARWVWSGEWGLGGRRCGEATVGEALGPDRWSPVENQCKLFGVFLELRVEMHIKRVR